MQPQLDSTPLIYKTTFGCPHAIHIYITFTYNVAYTDTIYCYI